ncbi:MAG: DUF2334 domain-containing protein, partial [Ignavibacteria bacterium]|nr:DUF2334 domain-containing protein [Ignavibacteria bacterium]
MKLTYQILILSLLTTQLYSQSKLLFVIRVDDIMSRNTTVLPRSIKPFEQIVESKGGKVTWFVIPHRLIESTNNDGSITRELRQTITKGHEVAQHGYNHICQRCNSSNHEMKCATYNSSFNYTEQKKLI